jgi:hypothetical protein
MNRAEMEFGAPNALAIRLLGREYAPDGGHHSGTANNN